MDPVKAERQKLARRILDLEHEIVTWSSKNSQSNPGAVMQLRAWQKELREARITMQALRKAASLDSKVK